MGPKKQPQVAKTDPPAKDQQQQQKAPAKRNNRKRGAQKVDANAQDTKPLKQDQAKSQPAKTAGSQIQKQKGKVSAAEKGAPNKKQVGASNKKQGGAQAQQSNAAQKNKRKRSGAVEKGATAGRGASSISTQDAARSKQRLELIIRSKYQNPDKDQPSQLESQICQYLVDLEASNKDLKPILRDLGVVAAREIQITPNKNAIIIFVPFMQHTKWQKIQDRVIRELEKKFSGQEVLFVAQRKVIKLNQIKNNVPRDRNTTITAVHDNLLTDIVYPTKIVGKRTRFRVGGKRILKVYLDPKDSKDIESRLSTYEVIYQKLTKKTVKFMFPRFLI